MQKWEYKVLKIEPAVGFSKIPNEFELNKLGSQGWKISASGGMGGYAQQSSLGGSPSYGWIILMRETFG